MHGPFTFTIAKFAMVDDSSEMRNQDIITIGGVFVGPNSMLHLSLDQLGSGVLSVRTLLIKTEEGPRSWLSKPAG